ncbi:MAG: leucine--tRNA ligase [Elusimicrobia bacterium]|nr:leucine--tRNA ligase [Elusimicrobiota bacterium]
MIQEIEIPKFADIDKKQQKIWADKKLFKSRAKPEKKKFYCLDMFPYPSGDGLHVGHTEGYTASDIVCRFKKMNNFDVLHPMGWDAFGLPAENYAIETGVHPEVTTKKNIDTFKRQINSIGLCYDWEREINTTSPDYYKWTQWIFLQLFKRDLAYEDTRPINWCPSCKTGLANEEVFQGSCERCQTPVEKKNLRQWILKITKYADRLLADLEGLNWPNSTMTMQKNWIGRSEGAQIHFKLENSEEFITVFTTRPDTIYGSTYMVLAPEHPLIEKLVSPNAQSDVKAYQEKAAGKSDLERTELEKTGVFIGAYAINPLNEEKIPIWIADYILSSYGTGAIMAVPAHDERDFEFAKKFNLPIIDVIKAPKDWEESKAYCQEGISINSPLINDLKTKDAKKKIIDFLSSKNAGQSKINFKLRDWVFSRQRYWGEPIPIINCAKCGAVAANEKDLPILLPNVEKYQPTGTGESPLAAIDSWVNVKCPKCQGPAKRETNTMPQWAGSCWYYLRFMDPSNKKEFVSPEIEKVWSPVDLYIGGAEHAVLHLLYARFWHKVLYDIGLVTEKEPFKKLVHQGMILSFAYCDKKGIYRKYSELDIKDNGIATLKETGETIKPVVEKMSKSKKNVINPDEIITKYGADAFRMYEMFIGPLEMAKPWDIHGIEGIYRFLKRIWRWGIQCSESIKNNSIKPDIDDKDLTLLRHQTIQKITNDVEELKFNTAISALMIYFNKINEKELSKEDFEIFLTILHPLAPHITDELWARAGNTDNLINRNWPIANEKVISERELEIPVQINGKVKAKIYVKETIEKEKLEDLAKESVKEHLLGKEIVKLIIVPRRLVSIVIKGGQ